MKFSDYIQKQGDEFRKAGDGYEALSDTSKACIDYAVQRFVDEYAKQQTIAFETWRRLQARDGNREIYGKTPDQLYQLFYDKFIEQQNKE